MVGAEDGGPGASSPIESWDQFQSRVYKEPWVGGQFIVDNDIAIPDAKLLKEFYFSLPAYSSLAISQTAVKSSKLTSISSQLAAKSKDGVAQRWPDRLKQNLTYCISDEFGPQKLQVIEVMHLATDNGWEKFAAVNFVYRNEFDGDCTATQSNVLFNVRPVNTGNYLAHAFFPFDLRDKRELLIDDTAFRDASSLDMILAHEVGHALGFRHEHIRAHKCTRENDLYRPLSVIDPASIMHYPWCDGTSETLSFSSEDAKAVGKYYGEPTDQPFEPVGGNEATETLNNLQIATGETKVVTSVKIAPRSTVTVRMKGVEGQDPGDPDLYVKFGENPGTQKYDCRPYRDGPVEACENLQGPEGVDTVYIGVYGTKAAKFSIEVTYTKPVVTP